MIRFTVSGQPIPKQSFRIGKYGGRYQDPKVKAWSEQVGWAAKEAMAGREPIGGPVSVLLEISRKPWRRVDVDNLSKGVLDGCNGIVWKDDTQVQALGVLKVRGRPQGVRVTIRVLWDLRGR